MTLPTTTVSSSAPALRRLRPARGSPAWAGPFPSACRLGFTLIELLVVMGIVGLLVASSVPALSQYAGRVRLKAATRQTVGLLHLARNLAISSRKARTVLIDPERRRLLIEETLDQPEPKQLQLPSAVSIEVRSSAAQQPEGPWRLVFQANGALAGRSVFVVLSNGPLTHTVVLTAPTGAITVQ